MSVLYTNTPTVYTNGGPAYMNGYFFVRACRRIGIVGGKEYICRQSFGKSLSGMNMKRYILLCLFVLPAVLLPDGAAAAAEPVAVTSEYARRHYTTQDGLPQMLTEYIWQDAKGYIWIGTLSGFVRYDGFEFTPYLKGKQENMGRKAVCGRSVSGASMWWTRRGRCGRYRSQGAGCC